MSKLKTLLIVLSIVAVIFLGILFFVINEAQVSVDLLVWQTPELPVSILVLGSFAVGVILGMMVTSVSVLKLKLRHRRPRKETSGSQALASKT